MDSQQRQKMIDQIDLASLGKIDAVSKKLKSQWSINGHCLHQNWDSLARSSGLSSSDIPALKKWVESENLSPPAKKPVSNKSI